MAESGWTDTRPKSPHLQIWKWHATMAASIFHRGTGIALYIGSFLIAAWLVAAASGPEAYSVVEGVLLSAVGRLILFGFTVALCFHFANGLRYLMWDGPKLGFQPKTASAISIFNIFFAVAGAVGLWAVAYFA